MFNHDAKLYISKLIRIRKRLLSEHANKRSELYVATNLSYLNRYLNAYDYNNWQMAGFFLRHQSEILSLVPGEGSKAHEKLYTEFENIKSEAIELTNNTSKL